MTKPGPGDFSRRVPFSDRETRGLILTHKGTEDLIGAFFEAAQLFGAVGLNILGDQFS